MTSKRLLVLCSAILMLALAVQIWSSMRTTSPTFDEPYHILRSYVYLKTGDSALLARGGHPPFANLLSVAPLLLRSDIVLPFHEPSWPDVRVFKDLFRVADEFFWRLGNDAESITFWSRLPMLFLSVCLAGLVFLWAKQRNGVLAGLLALLLYAFDPNIIAHSSVVTTDLGATFFVFASVYCLWSFCKRPSWTRLILTGVAFGLAQATKFSALFLIPIFFVLLMIWAFNTHGALSVFSLPLQSRQLPPTKDGSQPPQGDTVRCPWWRRVYLVFGLCLAIFLIGFVVLWAVYGFQMHPLLPHESSHPVLDRLIPGRNAALQRMAYALAENVPVPAPAYFSELAWLYNYSRAGHPSFLLGEYARSGWWYYFPIAFAIKTPIPLLILLLAAIYSSLRRREELWNEYFLLVPMGLFFVASTFSSIDIGYRNILPVLPLAFVYVSKVATRGSILLRLVLVALCVWYVIGTVALSPHYLAYFNELIGGPANGYKYLVDSNLDWGQDLKNLKKYMDARGIDWVYLSYFGTADPGYYGIHFREVPSVPPDPDMPPAYYAISATSLQGVYTAETTSPHWLAQYQPIDRVGYSILVYRLPDGDSVRATHPDWMTVDSTVSRTCLEIIPDRSTVKSAQERVLLLYEGTPEVGYLVLTSCGVKSGKHHTIYLNGQPVAQVREDSYNTCICNGKGRTFTYAIHSPSVVVNGWNYISVTNDADVTDSWIAYDARLVIEGRLSAAVHKEFTFASSFDGSIRRAVYQLPIGYNPDVPTPLLVSIGGTGEDRWDALYHYAERVIPQGWLLVAPDVRRLNAESKGRTASLATQHDIIDAIDYMKTHFNVDVNRIYMSGFSTGGGVAATVAAKYPHVFAAVVDWIGPTDFLELVKQRPDLYDGLVTYDFGCLPEEPALSLSKASSVSCRFEWQRRSAREMVMNLKHVPMAIVHGRADDRVPFAQSQDFYEAMRKFYDPSAHNKVAVWHDGGHFDAVPALRPLIFMAQFTLNDNPQDVMVRTDESKDYYWLHILQKDWNGQKADGFSNVVASYELTTRVISATVWDERIFAGGNLPVDVTFDLRAMGFEPDIAYTIEDENLATGSFITRRGVLPKQGYLTLSVPRDALGKVHHRYVIYPFEPWMDRPFFSRGYRPDH